MNRRNLLMSLGAFPILAAAQPFTLTTGEQYIICYKLLSGNNAYTCYYYKGTEKEIKNHIFQFEGEILYFVIFKNRDNLLSAYNYLKKDGMLTKELKEDAISYGVIPVNDREHGKKKLFCNIQQYA